VTARLAAIVALTACAAWLRQAALGFGLPDLFHPAEQRSIAALQALLPSADPSAIALASRAVAAAIGTASVPLTYLAASALGPVAAFGAASVVAAATPAVRAAKLATGDALGSALVAALLIGAGRVERGGGARAVGAIVAVVALEAALFVALGILSPPCLDGIRADSIAATASPWKALPDQLGAALALAIVAAFVLALLRRRRGTLAPLAVSATGIAACSLPGASVTRALPIALPGLAILLGAALEDVVGFAARRISAKLVLGLTIAAVAVLLVPSLIRDWKLGRLLVRPDTRAVAQEWIEARVPPTEEIAVLRGGCALPRFAASRPLLVLDSPAELVDSGARWIVLSSTPFSVLSPELDAAAARRLDAWGELVLDVEPREAGTPAPIYDPLDPLFLPLQHASSVKRAGPRIRVWRRHAS
jgi:hypothetical protein